MEPKYSYFLSFSVLVKCTAFFYIMNTLAYASVLKVPDRIPTNTSCKNKLPQFCGNVCLTRGCVMTASDMLSKIDFALDPCENFYKFSCGTFLKETTIPDNKNMVTLFDENSDKIMRQLRTAVEEPIRLDEPKYHAMAKNFYKSCMNTSRIEEEGLVRIKTILKRAGGWPVLEGDAWDETKFSWLDTMTTVKDFGFFADGFLPIGVTTDDRNPTRRLIKLYGPWFSPRRQDMIQGRENRVVEALYHYMCDVAVLMGADKDKAHKELNEALQFEIQLAHISPPDERDSRKLNNLMTIRQLQEKVPSISWLDYIQRQMPESVTVELDEVISVEFPKYIDDLEALLRKTPNRTLANYLMWHTVKIAVPWLTRELRDREQKYYASRSILDERWKFCLSYRSRKSLDLALYSLYLKSVIENDRKEAVKDIAENVQKQMYTVLENADWMDEATRAKAIKKAGTIMFQIDYPDEILNDKLMEEHYAKLELHGEDYLESVLNISKFEQANIFNQLREPVNRADWKFFGNSILDVNSYYHAERNSIVLPAGILQDPFFSQERPNYINYAKIGFVIGHEITHGFDAKNRFYDDESNLANWWTPQTEVKFLEKADCITQQYGNYTAEEIGIKLDGMKTQYQNIADNGGLKMAYNAYNGWLQKHGEEKRLPGLESFTPRQMFWISAAQTFCEKSRPDELKRRVNGQHFTIGEYRILGSFSNRVEFSEDFQCPLGSKMNPTSKCQVF